MTESVILAFSGGLDTSVSVAWIKEKFGYRVITVTVDVGQEEDLDAVEERAYAAGAEKHYTIDAKRDFAENYIFPSIKANGLYEEKYPLGTALARPLIALKLVEVAKSEKASIISHGCTGKGNDQARFDITIKALLPSAKIVAPVREWNLSREEEIGYAEKMGIPLDKKSTYSIDQNLWGRSIEGGNLEDLDIEPPQDAFQWIRDISQTPDEPEIIILEFDGGILVGMNGKRDDPVKMISQLNEKVGMHGFGIVDHVEDRLIGIKSREVYEAPAALAIMEAHRDLEKMVLTRHEIEVKSMLERRWAWMVYSGLWVDPLMDDLNAFVNSTQKRVRGSVRLRVHKGSCRVVGRRSENSLYRLDLATYGPSSTFDQRAAEGFIQLWGMQSRLARSVSS